jgi:hypothetical protein
MAREKDPAFPAPREIGGPGRADLYSLREIQDWAREKGQ